jgi:hypothetical protein
MRLAVMFHQFDFGKLERFRRGLLEFAGHVGRAARHARPDAAQPPIALFSQPQLILDLIDLELDRSNVLFEANRHGNFRWISSHDGRGY